jgi:Domain of unknown function (DUF4148)
MKRTLLVLALLVSSSAFANDVDPFGFDQQAFVSSKTRAEVRDELRQARASGEISYQPTYGDHERKSAPYLAAKSRAEVEAELAQARAQGEESYDEIDYPLATAHSHAQLQAAAAHG